MLHLQVQTSQLHNVRTDFFHGTLFTSLTHCGAIYNVQINLNLQGLENLKVENFPFTPMLDQLQITFHQLIVR